MRRKAKNIGIGDATTHPSSLSSHGKLRWRSRRGMLELDILLERFWGRFGDGLPAEDAEALEALLGYEDIDLLELILHGEGSEITCRVLQMLRAGR